jgi:Holliday junction resolvase-like predicted endonuclease
VPREGVVGPDEYESVVAAHFASLGYRVEDRPASPDWGVDVIAENSSERVAVQAKMYGGSARPVNRAQIMELYGVAAYFDCTRAVLATNGRVMTDAAAVAAKLGIEVLRIEARESGGRVRTQRPLASAQPSESGESFDGLWRTYIIPLVGTKLRRADGTANQIVAVDWAGLDRITSSGRAQHIKIEIFRFAIDKVLTQGRVTRDEINALYPGRASSGIVLILSQIPAFKYVDGELRRRT